MRKILPALVLCCIVFFAPSASAVTIRDFDISYHRYLNTDIVKNPDAANIEEIIRYWADALYESSNGEELLGTVRIFQGPTSFLSSYRLADIVWEEAGHPRAAFGAYDSYDAQKPLGLRMAMFDSFRDYSSGEILKNLLSPENHAYAGYALAALCGFFVHDLREEYAIERNGKKYPALQFPTILNDVAPAAFEGDLRALNHSTKALYGNGPATAQKKKWGVSAWEYLAEKRGLPKKALPAAPKGKKKASLDESEYRFLIQPGKHSRDAQRQLRIVWVSSPIFQIVIDKSGSMGDNGRFEKAKNAAKEFVRSLHPGTRAGIISFDENVYVESPILTVSSGGAEKKKLLKTIDDISLKNNTAIYDACSVAAREMSKDRNSFYEGRYIVLFTDGADNSSRLGPDDLIADLRKENVSVLVMGLEEGVQERTLRRIAAGTKGYYMMTATPLDTQEMLYGYLNNAYESQLHTADMVLPKGASKREAFDLEAGAELLRVTLIADGEISPKDMALTVTPPKGKAASLAHDRETGKIEMLQKTPGAGKWTVTVKNNSSRQRQVRITAFVKTKERVLYLVNVLPVRGDQQNTAVVYASLTGNATPHTGLSVKGTVREPSGAVRPLEFHDMGYGPDATAGDGIYSALVENCAAPGNYKVTVSFANTGGGAETNQRYAFLNPSARPEGTYFVVADKGHPMPRKLQRVGTATFQIEGGKVADDSKKVIREEKPIDFERVKSLLDRGRQALERHSHDQAESYAKDVLRLDRNNAEAYQLIGEARDGANNHTGAIEAFGKAVELKPGDPFLYFRLGQSHTYLRKRTEARRVYDEMRRRFPNDKWTNRLEMAIRHMEG